MMGQDKLSEVENAEAKGEEAGHQPDNGEDPAIWNFPVILEEDPGHDW